MLKQIRRISIKTNLLYAGVLILLLYTLAACVVVQPVATSMPAEAPAPAEEFPAKEVQVIIPYAAGGATDLIFRALAESSGKYLGKPVVVMNKPGGGGAVGFTEAAQSPADGYTLVTAITPLTILPHQVETTFTYQDFAPVINVVEDPAMFLVQADAPWKDVNEFLEYARNNPGQVNVGNSGAGGGVHLIALAFEKAVDAEFNHVPFEGGGPSVTALLGGHVDAVVVSPPEGISNVQAGTLRIIALFAEKRLDLFPDVPTVKEQGIDFAMGQWRGLAAPKGTPAEAIEILHAAFKQGMEDPQFLKNAEDMSVNLHYMGPDDLSKRMVSDHEFYGNLVKEIKEASED
jgi:tripartite-type tricarboxylate transporter receptor subunit TctC